MTPASKAEIRREILERFRDIVLAFALIAVTLVVATMLARFVASGRP